MLPACSRNVFCLGRVTVSSNEFAMFMYFILKKTTQNSSVSSRLHSWISSSWYHVTAIKRHESKVTWLLEKCSVTKTFYLHSGEDLYSNWETVLGQIIMSLTDIVDMSVTNVLFFKHGTGNSKRLRCIRIIEVSHYFFFFTFSIIPFCFVKRRILKLIPFPLSDDNMEPGTLASSYARTMTVGSS